MKFMKQPQETTRRDYYRLYHLLREAAHRKGRLREIVRQGVSDVYTAHIATYKHSRTGLMIWCNRTEYAHGWPVPSSKRELRSKAAGIAARGAAGLAIEAGRADRALQRRARDFLPV